MKQLLIVLIALFAYGCNRTSIIPANDTESNAIAISAYAVTATVKPKPADVVSDKCQNCNGTGKVGDGRIVMTCKVCGGTGKAVKTESVAIESELQSGGEVIHDLAIEEPSNEPKVSATEEAHAKQEPLPSPKVDIRILTVNGLKSCVRCKDWIKKNKVEWEREGFSVIPKLDDGSRVVPWFRIQDGKIDKEAGSELTLAIYKQWKAANYE